jgi:hypothetical protein
MPGDRPKRQHWVPESYQRNFATAESRNTKKPQVYFWDKDAERQPEKPTAAKNVCVRQYLYAPTDKSGLRDWALELALGKVETDIAERWLDFRSSYPDLSEELLRSQLALFVATLHLRNVSIESTINKIIELRDKLYGQKTPDRPDTDLIGVPPRKLGASVGSEFPFDANDAHRAFVQTVWSSAEKITASFYAKSWAVLCCEEDVFITTDKPVLFFSADGRAAGPGTPGAISMFPINTRRLLLMGDAGKVPTDRYITIDTKKAATFSSQLWDAAIRFVISCRPLTEVRQIINDTR